MTKIIIVSGGNTLKAFKVIDEEKAKKKNTQKTYYLSAEIGGFYFVFVIGF